MELGKKECEGCNQYKVLNPRHIVDGKPYKSCDSSEHPDYCKIELEKPQKEYFFGGKL